jgi:uncharacterized protein (UPF0128 family)
MQEIDKDSVRTILQGIASMDRTGEIVKDDGSIDITNLLKDKQRFRECISDLKELGVTEKWLNDNGFAAASIILGAFLTDDTLL